MKLLILQNFEPFKTGRIKTVNFKRKNSNDSSFSYVNSFGFLCWIEMTIFLYDRFLVGWHFTFVSLGADVNLILGLFFLTIDWFDRIRAHFLVWNGFIKQALSVAFSVCGYTWISDFWTNVPGFAIIFSSMDPIRSSIYRLSRSCFHHLLFNILPLTAFCGDRVFKFLSFSMVDFIRFHRGSIQFSSIRPASSVGNTFFPPIIASTVPHAVVHSPTCSSVFSWIFLLSTFLVDYVTSPSCLADGQQAEPESWKCDAGSQILIFAEAEAWLLFFTLLRFFSYSCSRSDDQILFYAEEQHVAVRALVSFAFPNLRKGLGGGRGSRGSSFVAPVALCVCVYMCGCVCVFCVCVCARCGRRKSAEPAALVTLRSPLNDRVVCCGRKTAINSIFLAHQKKNNNSKINNYGKTFIPFLFDSSGWVFVLERSSNFLLQ